MSKYKIEIIAGVLISWLLTGAILFHEFGKEEITEEKAPELVKEFCQHEYDSVLTKIHSLNVGDVFTKDSALKYDGHTAWYGIWNDVKLQEKDKLLEEANIQIENFKGMDVEGIKKAADEYKAKYEQSAAEAKTKETEYQQKLQEQAYDFKLNETVSNLKFPNELTKNAFVNELKAKKLPLEGDKLLGFDDYIKEVGEKNPGLFVTEEAPTDPTPEVILKPTNTQQLNNNPMNFNFTPIHNVPTN